MPVGGCDVGRNRETECEPQQLGLEGIVSKRRDAPYRSGRCADWTKVKNPDAPAATRSMELMRAATLAASTQAAGA
jgi:ATP-dependent DNA ligase